ncbi:thermonuclease family protein [Citrobacter braakii]|uniref:thermonuclease family protein n=1 Tax=Citrobacter braakii TaxID=57706 RepID=UPI0022350C24
MTGIDAPEKAAIWSISRQSLSGLVSQKHAYITGHEFDRYNRLLGTVWSGRTDINAAQIHRGMAWAYRFKGQISSSEYGILENEAKTNRTGLCSASSQTEPWTWRRIMQKNKYLSSVKCSE